jgi:Archaeal/vacuolar-type H+-ATPase subunit F
MARVLYLGDEVTAAGLRLAGVETLVVAPGNAVDAVLRETLDDDCDCVLLSAALARCIPAPGLQDALRRGAPLLAVVPDVRSDERLPDLAAEVRDALGLET